jgi:hypothetical protein
VVPDSYRLDGWPLCPACGEDELGDIGHEVASPMNDLFCHRCARVTVRAGESQKLQAPG